MKIIHYILLFSLVLATNAFSEAKANFGQYLFELDLGKRLPDRFIVEYLKQKPSEHFTWKINKIEKYPNYYCIIASEASVVGYNLFLYTFTNDGNPINSLKLSESADATSYSTEYEYLDDNLILVKRVGFDSWQTPTTIEQYKLEFYKIHDGKINKTNGYQYPFTKKYRHFPEISKYKLDYKLIITFKKAELRLMRNEIFAHHGYIFQNPKLMEYFSTFEWYSPNYKDVSDVLNEIEKYNLDLIRKVEIETN